MDVALQLVLHAANSEQMERRLDRLLEVVEPRLVEDQGRQLQAFGALWQHFYDTAIFSEDEDAGSDSNEDDQNDVAGLLDDDDDDDNASDSDGYDEPRLLGQRLRTGATTPDDYGPAPMFTTEHCPPLSVEYGPDPAENCQCAGPCLCETTLRDWLVQEWQEAIRAADDGDREPNNLQRKRCYRKVAIQHLHLEFREPLPPCVVISIRRIWPSASGLYMGFKSR